MSLFDYFFSQLDIFKRHEVCLFLHSMHYLSNESLQRSCCFCISLVFHFDNTKPLKITSTAFQKNLCHNLVFTHITETIVSVAAEFISLTIQSHSKLTAMQHWHQTVAAASHILIYFNQTSLNGREFSLHHRKITMQRTDY